jgi:hypothetical protein
VEPLVSIWVRGVYVIEPKISYMFIFVSGQVGWGISWYINGILIPVLNVTRGMTYTFIVEGGTDTNNLARYHPFYISNSINGGRLQNSPEAVAVRKDIHHAYYPNCIACLQGETVYAGFDGMGDPTGSRFDSTTYYR